MSASPVARGPLKAQSHAVAVAAPRNIAGIVPPPLMVLCSMLSMQLGAATAKALLTTHSASSVVLLRTGFAALVLLLVARPQLFRYSVHQWRHAAALGVAIAVLNLAFYESISRIPLGITMTIQFLGPFMVALAASQKVKDWICPILAFGGVLLLAPTGNLRSLSLAGIAFAFVAAVAWAAYLILAKRTTAMFSGTTGLALAMSFGSLAILPFGVLSASKSLLDLPFLAMGFLVSVLSTAIPFSLEFLALKRMSARTFGILTSADPAVAALVGLLILHEHLALRAWAALALVSIATVGVISQDGKSQTRSIKLENTNNT